MKKLSIIFFILIIASLIIISGCGEKPECERSSDCKAEACNTVRCVDSSCNYEPISNCCGNGIMEEKERVGSKTYTIPDKDINIGSCLCPEDYGECSIENNFNQYSDYSDIINTSCVDNKCKLKMNFDVKGNTQTEDMKETKKFQLQLNLKYNNPFDVNKDLFEVEVNPQFISDNIKEIDLKHVKLIGTPRKNGPSMTIIDNDLVESIKSKSNHFTVDFPIKLPNTDAENEFSGLKLELSYDYIDKDNVRSDLKSFQVRNLLPRDNLFKTINIPMKYDCDESKCDDNNIATRDFCAKDKGYCLHEYLNNRCGNYICEVGENSCKCPIDCGECSGKYGPKYLTKTCVKNRCILTFDGSNRVQKINSNSIGNNMKFQIQMNANKPLDITKDKLEFKITFQQNTNQRLVDNKVKIIEYTITDNYDTLIATSSSNDDLIVGHKVDYTMDLNDYYMEKRESEVSIKYSFRVRYEETDSQSQQVDKYATLTGSFNKWDFVKPGDFEE